MDAPLVEPGASGVARDHRQSLSGRAFMSLAWLVGFYVLAAAVVALVVGANVALVVYAHRLPAFVVIPSVVVVIAIVRGTLFVGGKAEEGIEGVEVDETSQPELVGLVRSVAEEMGTEPPTRIVLVPDVNAYVVQTGRFLGLLRGQRIMALGVGLVHSVTVDQLRAVIAHELGHYAGGDTRLGPLSYRAAATIYRTVEHLGERSLIARFFDAYGRRYLRLSQRVRRRQELSADATAVRLAGRENHVSALRRTAAAGPAWSCFVRWYVVPLWERGSEPVNLFEGFRAMLDDPRRQAELAELDTDLDGAETHPFDSHPSLAERVAQARALPELNHPGDDRPAALLLCSADALEQEVSGYFTVLATGRSMGRRLDWDAAAGEVFGADLAADGDRLLRAAGVGRRADASLATAVDLVEAGRADELVQAVVGDLDGVAADELSRVRRDVVIHFLGSAIGAYLVAERGCAWRMSWSGCAVAVDAKGKVLDPFEIAAGLVDDPSSAAAARRRLGGRARMEHRTVAPTESDGRGDSDSIVGVLPHVTLMHKVYDLVATRTELILHPASPKPGLRWRYALTGMYLHKPYQKALARRLEVLLRRGPKDLATPGPDAVVIERGQVEGVKSMPMSGRVTINVKGARVDLKVVTLQDKATLQELLAA